ncbi:MAG: hypothetical protein ACFFD2_01105 [Promethearchaeota archaeon]
MKKKLAHILTKWLIVTTIIYGTSLFILVSEKSQDVMLIQGFILNDQADSDYIQLVQGRIIKRYIELGIALIELPAHLLQISKFEFFPNR